MTSLATIRAKLKEQEAKTDSTSYGDNTIYPFWNMKANETATIRFLPDGNESNDFFWIERTMLKLPFNGIVGKADTKFAMVQVPCVEMYGDTCPVLTEVRTWFKDSSLEDLGRKYWKKRSYIFQGFVVDNPISEESPPDNPIRKFIIGPQIIKLIKSSLMDPDMDDMPTDYTNGLDFRLYKTDSSSGFADYTASKWARKERPLSDAEMKAINDYGLFDLRTALPKKPNDVELKVIFEMFEASVNGEAYDEDKWGEYFKPFNISDNSSSSDTGSATASKATPPKKETASAKNDAETPPWNDNNNSPETTEKSSDDGNKAEDILAMIRARQQQ